MPRGTTHRGEVDGNIHIHGSSTYCGGVSSTYSTLFERGFWLPRRGKFDAGIYRLGEPMTPNQIKKMPLVSITLPLEAKSFMDGFFRDILERHALSGDLYAICREAYVLGARHAQIGMESISAATEGATP